MVGVVVDVMVSIVPRSVRAMRAVRVEREMREARAVRDGASW